MFRRLREGLNREAALLTLPTAGCWEITGSYRCHEMGYVVWIPGPDN